MVLTALLAAALLPALQAPLLPPAERLQPVAARDVHLAADSFWGPRVATNLLVSLKHGAAMLEEHGQFGNFRMAAAKQGHALPAGDVAPDKYAGCFYYDSDAYKWLEACCLALQQDAPEGTDPAAVVEAKSDIRGLVDRFVEEIAAAQREDGYLNTQYLVEGWTPFSKLASDHELYCAGHLIQAACAHHDATGNRRLLDVALKFADLLDRTFGPDEGKGQRKGCCGHPEIETALVQLYHHTGEKRWLDLASFFLECRGHGLVGGDDYRQDDKPIREQHEARGHAVRQLYLCSGVLGVGEETGDAGLIDANLDIWKDIVAGKLYVTGGLGARPDGEAFGAPFELPNEHAYSETCASVAWMRWNDELLQATGDSKYADALETTLYNAFLASTGEDGKSFFYVNPLESRGGVHREPWYWCACCPPNVMRTFAGLPGWFASTTKDTLWIHLYDDCTIDATLGDGRKVKVQLVASPLQPNSMCVKLVEAPAGSMSLALRLPAYMHAVNAQWIQHHPSGASHDLRDDRAGARTLVVAGTFSAGDIVNLRSSVSIERLSADSRVREDAGQEALRVGPLVYACESTDQAAELTTLALGESGQQPFHGKPDDSGVNPIFVPGLRSEAPVADSLYAERRPFTTEALIVLRPYYAWANRGDSKMRVWMPKALGANTFADDAELLRVHGGVEILRAEGCGPVAVSPTLTGRVMTSALSDAEPGFGFINRAALQAAPLDLPEQMRQARWPNYGGEDRLWLAPEGGPHGLFFAAGVPQSTETWHVPWSMDGVERQRTDPAVAVVSRVDLLPMSVELGDASGVRVSVSVERSIEALSRPAVGLLLERPLPPGVRVVAFRSTNRISWNGALDPKALLGLWTLGQFTPSDHTTVLVPFRGDALGPAADPAAIAAACIKRDYFGVVPDGRLKFELPPGPQAAGLARFTADSRLRSKIGLSRAGATGWIGAWDAERGVLTLINYSLPPVGAPVPDCDWRVPNPHAAQGDVATSYNNGGEPAFFELESLSAALPATAGASVEHISTTIHLGGDREALRDIARAVLHAEL